MMERHSILWRRLDSPGHDACRLIRRREGSLIEGAATFRDGRAPASIVYQIECDRDWRTVFCEASGWAANGPVRFSARKGAEGGWTIDARPTFQFDKVEDVDLGFTPMTNLLPIRRLRLAVGESAEVTAVWLDPADWAVKPLRQTYERLSSADYRYASPEHGYGAVLRTDAFGFVVDYPGLWIAEG